MGLRVVSMCPVEAMRSEVQREVGSSCTVPTGQTRVASHREVNMLKPSVNMSGKFNTAQTLHYITKALEEEA